MKQILAEEKPCECGAPVVIKVPIGSGKYEGFCLECGTGYDTDYVAELIAMMEEIHA